MEIYNTWFELEESKTDAQNVINFLAGLPGRMSVLIQDYNSNFFEQLAASGPVQVIREVFMNALEEATMQLLSNLMQEREKLQNPVYALEFNSRLTSIGFTENSLRLKAHTLNFHWEKLLTHVHTAGNTIIDFANNSVVKLVKRFLDYLNSVLGSLIKLFPGAEPIKEIKEIIESYLGIAEE